MKAVQYIHIYSARLVGAVAREPKYALARHVDTHQGGGPQTEIMKWDVTWRCIEEEADVSCDPKAQPQASAHVPCLRHFDNKGLQGRPGHLIADPLQPVLGGGTTPDDRVKETQLTTLAHTRMGQMKDTEYNRAVSPSHSHRELTPLYSDSIMMPNRLSVPSRICLLHGS